MSEQDGQLRLDALTILQAAIRAADADMAVRNHLTCTDTCLQIGDLRLPLSSFDRLFLISVGKASVEMAHAIEAILGDRLSGGLVVTKYGHQTKPLRRLKVMETGHPIPDQAGIEAAHEVAALASSLTARDLLLVALSGGASALLPAPAPSITLAAKQQTTDLLLSCGASIQEINVVRKKLSTLKGGQLARLAAPASVLTLIVSDVIGNPSDVIGSGLTSPDPATFADARDVLDRYGLTGKVPASVRLRLEAGSRGNLPDTPKPGDPVFANVHTHIVASNQLALQAAYDEATSRGYNARILSSTLIGETREVASAQAHLLRELVHSGTPVPVPACLISGGETTVTLRGEGKGGRNMEFTLAAALGLAGLSHALVLSAGTDGTDGPTDAAGALASGDTLERAKHIHLDPLHFLDNNDSYTFFNALGDLIRTGPTGTNVMDVHLLMAR